MGSATALASVSAMVSMVDTSFVARFVTAGISAFRIGFAVGDEVFQTVFAAADEEVFQTGSAVADAEAFQTDFVVADVVSVAVAFAVADKPRTISHFPGSSA